MLVLCKRLAVKTGEATMNNELEQIIGKHVFLVPELAECAECNVQLSMDVLRQMVTEAFELGAKR